jgi:hypothetical protein
MPNVDWVIHKVINEIGPGGIVNAHTHGMERYGQVDFQLALPFTLEKSLKQNAFNTC